MAAAIVADAFLHVALPARYRVNPIGASPVHLLSFLAARIPFPQIAGEIFLSHHKVKSRRTRSAGG